LPDESEPMRRGGAAISVSNGRSSLVGRWDSSLIATTRSLTPSKPTKVTRFTTSRSTKPTQAIRVGRRKSRARDQIHERVQQGPGDRAVEDLAACFGLGLNNENAGLEALC
jgi:hypothetical protein